MTHDFRAATQAEYAQTMQQLSKQHGGCWIACRVFDYIYARRYATASKIPYSRIGETPGGVYYKDGVACEFTAAKQRKYDNSALGCE